MFLCLLPLPNSYDVRILNGRPGNGFWIMDGREDGIYWKSSFLSFHDLATPICWLVKRAGSLHWLGLGVLLGPDRPNYQTKSNLIQSQPTWLNQANQRNVGKVTEFISEDRNSLDSLSRAWYFLLSEKSQWKNDQTLSAKNDQSVRTNTSTWSPALYYHQISLCTFWPQQKRAWGWV